MSDTTRAVLYNIVARIGLRNPPINLKSVKALALTIPQSILSRADEVIE